MDKSIDSIGSCSLDADSTDFSGNFNIKREKMATKWERNNMLDRFFVDARRDSSMQLRSWIVYRS